MQNRGRGTGVISCEKGIFESMAETVPTVCHFPGHLPDYAHKASFSSGLGLYKMVDVTPVTGEDGDVTVMYNYENPRDDPKNVLVAAEPSVPLLPPNQAYIPGYTTTYSDIFRKQAHLQVLPQFSYLCDSFPSLVFGPAADRDLIKGWRPLRKDLPGETFREELSSRKPNVHVMISLHFQDNFIVGSGTGIIALKSLFSHPYIGLHGSSVDKLEDAIFLGCPRDLLLNELHAELDYKGIEKHANHLHHGGCLCFMPVACDTSSIAGFLLYPSGAAMDILTITTLSPHVEESSWVHLTAKPENEIQRIRLGGVIRQIESVQYADKRKHFCIVRTDYQAHIVQIGLSEDGNATTATITKTINTQHRITSVAHSPFIQQEYVCALDSSEVILAESNDRLLRSETIPSADRRTNPIFCHFGAHPREVFVHDQNEALIYDLRCAIRTKRALFKLPHTCLSSDQRFFVARQHPTNHFYHYIATQDALVLLDQRFPEHPVLQTCHNVQGLPSYLEICLYEDTHPKDIVMVGNHNEKQVHCFFVDGNKEPPVLSSSIWKISPYHDWPEMLDDAHPPTTTKTWERLEEPLLGVVATQLSVGFESSWTVLQISAAGDVFCQTFTAPAGEFQPKQDVTSKSSLRLCDLWLKSVHPAHLSEETPVQRCRKRPYLEYHRTCERCGVEECILGAKRLHGLPRALDNVRKNKKVNEAYVFRMGKELQELWKPTVCKGCTDLCMKDMSMFGVIRIKNKGFLKSLKLPWEKDLEQSKVTFTEPTTEGASPVKTEKMGNEEATEMPTTTSRIEISAEDGHSSLVISDGEWEVPLSQSTFKVTNPEHKEEKSFHMILENKKQKVAAKRRRSNNAQSIGF